MVRNGGVKTPETPASSYSAERVKGDGIRRSTG